jgi:hypothetical protein
MRESPSAIIAGMKTGIAVLLAAALPLAAALNQPVRT